MSLVTKGTLVKGTHRCEPQAGMVIRTKRFNRTTGHLGKKVEATVAEVVFQTGTNERAIYVFASGGFHLIKDTRSNIAPTTLEIA